MQKKPNLIMNMFRMGRSREAPIHSYGLSERPIKDAPLFFKKKRKLFLEFKITFQSSFIVKQLLRAAILVLPLFWLIPPNFWLQNINCIPFRLFFSERLCFKRMLLSNYFS